MVACVSPSLSNIEESLNCLRYANRAKNIQNNAVMNVDANTTKVVEELKTQVKTMSKEIITVKSHMKAMAKELLRMQDLAHGFESEIKSVFSVDELKSLAGHSGSDQYPLKVKLGTELEPLKHAEPESPFDSAEESKSNYVRSPGLPKDESFPVISKGITGEAETIQNHNVNLFERKSRNSSLSHVVESGSSTCDSSAVDSISGNSCSTRFVTPLSHQSPTEFNYGAESNNALRKTNVKEVEFMSKIYKFERKVAMLRMSLGRNRPKNNGEDVEVGLCLEKMTIKTAGGDNVPAATKTEMNRIALSDFFSFQVVLSLQPAVYVRKYYSKVKYNCYISSYVCTWNI